MLEVSIFVWSSKFTLQDTWEGTSVLIEEIMKSLVASKNCCAENGPWSDWLPWELDLCLLAGWIVRLVSMTSQSVIWIKHRKPPVSTLRRGILLLRDLRSVSESNSLFPNCALIWISFIVLASVMSGKSYVVLGNIRCIAVFSYVLGPFPQNIQSLTNSQHFKRLLPTSSWCWICLNADKKALANFSCNLFTLLVQGIRRKTPKFMYHCVNWEATQHAQRMVTMNVVAVQWKWWYAWNRADKPLWNSL